MKTRPQGTAIPLIGFVPSKAPVIHLPQPKPVRPASRAAKAAMGAAAS